MSCAHLSNDRSFGPRVYPGCRSFDFTLYFEDVFLACLPSVLFLLLAPSRMLTLLRLPPAFSVKSRLLCGKLVALAVLLAFQIAFLVLRTRTRPFQTSASVAADALALAATTAVCLLSVLSHQRSQRPSTLLSLYLSAAAILGVARVRTAWLIGDAALASATALTFVLVSIVAALLLESVESKKGVPRDESLSDSKQATPEQSSGFWARTLFTWLARTFYSGYSRVISPGDLPGLDPSLESRALHEDLAVAWDKYDHQSRRSLLRACLRSYLGSFLSPVLPRLCLTIFTFTQPFLINTTVSFVAQKDADSNYGRGLIGAWALVYLGIAVSGSVFRYHNLRFKTRLRGGLIALIYQQTIHTREVDAGEITAVALMGTDVERITGAMSMFHAVWASLLDIAVASWLLGLQLSLACLAPIILVLVFISAVSKISVATKTAQTRWIEKIQERLRTTAAMLGEMKAVKMLGLGEVMSNKIRHLREDEIGTSKSFRKLLVATLLLSLTPINLAPIVTFGVYALISVFWKSGTLLPAQAFTSIALISLLTTPVVSFIQLLPMVVQSLACFDRIQDFCNYSHNAQIHHQRPRSPSRHHGQPRADPGRGSLISEGTKRPSLSPGNHIVSWKGQSFGWHKDKTTLHDLTIDIQRGAVTVVVGPVGSGKSSFLSAILGNLISTSPVAKPTAGRGCQRDDAAYCSQTPWLENGTVRQNILGASFYEQKWYDTVVSACALEADMQALPKGDFTLVGSKGVSLSGGQKQRVALARAVYSRHKVVVLDDVFAGMDARTAHHVLNRLIGPDGLFKKQRASVVVATHHHNAMALADNIITIERGRIQEIGSPEILVRRQGYVSKLGLRLLPCDGVAEDKAGIDAPEAPIDHPPVELSDRSEEDEILHTDVRRRNGETAVYAYYFRNAGWKAVALYGISVVAWIFFSEFSTVWIKWWSEANTAAPNKSIGYYMGVYALFGVLGTLTASLAAWFAFLDVVSNTAFKLHADLLRTVLAAPFRFLARTDSGELLNRFSEDMQLLDMDLPVNMVNYTSTAVSVLAKLAVLAVFSQYLGAGLPLLGLVLYALQRFYLRTSRQVRLLEIEAKAPLYAHFSESAAGAATIRAFGWQAAYQARGHRRADASQRPAYAQGCVQSWLSLALDLAVAALAVALVSAVVAWRDGFGAGAAGVSLVMVVGFSEVLARLIQTWTRLESSVGAVARVRRFVTETEAEASVGKSPPPPASWPSAGALGFSNVVASYSPDTDPVLKGVTLTIDAGQHVAVAGRSGSGKTSLVLGLLQMMDVREGKIELDGVDVSTLAPAELRSRINVVSQDPFLIPGTVRANIDPFGACPGDAEITRALERVGLWGLVRAQGGLDGDADAESWSAGQKQLLCLARAMVRRSKLLVLDEAMGSVDAETEALMQEIVDTEFGDCTVLAVMHRLKHVSRYDRVALLGDGELLEFGEPACLISGRTRFAELYKMNEN
ncbi:ABC transporter [Colletotrichum navitas]|uniref:ABC transporter n=1 Tax=Colletotrichum navitas TaxID=681940 RepID=A0AAD8Q7Q1_9PEZI|nr:ABC transporter [Colletotrichum navitas]KAK1597503.1 ABC transporter [Colletotrichum navitas]